MHTNPAQASADSLLLPAVEVETGLQPRHAVIWLHGLGADGHDFEPVVDAFERGRLPAIRFVFPHAPERPVTINGGYVMRAWYDVLSPDIGKRQEDEPGLRLSAQQLTALMARENARGVADERIVLAGFSQGGAVVLHTGLRHPRRLAGIIALSTYVPLAGSLAREAHAANRDTPIFMAHGHEDAMIPYDFGLASGELLREQGYPVVWHGYAVEHGLCIEEVRDIETWLGQVFGEEG